LRRITNVAFVTLYRLVNSPNIEAAEIVQKLLVRDEKTCKMALWSLKKFIRVCQYYLFVGALVDNGCSPRKRSLLRNF
jgi:hypothetical protein